MIPSAAGLHVTATVTAATRERIDQVVRRAFLAGVTLVPLSLYDVGPPTRAGLVLGYGAVPGERIAEGLRRLRACFQD